MNQDIETKLNEILDRGLCKGQGDPEGQVCIEAAIAIACDEPFSDRPSCVADVVRQHSIVLNDCSFWVSDKSRADSLRAYALNQLGCRQIDARAFAERLAIRNVREILPIALRALAELDCFAGTHREALETSIKLCASVQDLASAKRAAKRAAESAASAAESAWRAAWRVAESAASAAESAKRAASAAESAAESAASAAKSAWRAAESAAPGALGGAESAAASAAESAWCAAKSAWRAAASAAESAASVKSAAASAASAASAGEAVLVAAVRIANEVLTECKKEAGL